MRKIKFRQAIFHPITEEFTRWHYWGLIDGVFVGIDTGWYSPKQAIENSYQYTGLKDKNGKEVYEGDLLTAGYWGTVGYYGEDTFLVEFEEGAFRGFMCEYMKRKKLRWSHSTPLYKLEGIEVIGNIYENKELLK